MAVEFEIVMPWPNAALSPNGRRHFQYVAKLKKAARLQAFSLAREAGAHRLPFPKDERLMVWIVGYAPDRRRRDADNLLASMKGALDGLADALGIDDRRFVPSIYIADEVRKPACVRVVITEFQPPGDATP